MTFGESWLYTISYSERGDKAKLQSQEVLLWLKHLAFTYLWSEDSGGTNFGATKWNTVSEYEKFNV